MPFENLEEEGLEKNPNLELAQKKYLLTTEQYKNDVTLKKELMDAIESDSRYSSRSRSRSDMTGEVIICSVMNRWVYVGNINQWET